MFSTILVRFFRGILVRYKCRFVSPSSSQTQAQPVTKNTQAQRKEKGQSPNLDTSRDAAAASSPFRRRRDDSPAASPALPPTPSKAPRQDGAGGEAALPRHPSLCSFIWGIGSSLCLLFISLGDRNRMRSLVAMLLSIGF